MKTITINASQSYDVIIDKGIINDCGKYISQTGLNGRVAVITDRTVDVLYSQVVLKSLSDNGYEVYKYVVDGGEESKSGKVFLEILEFLAENGFTRSDFLVALGGGVIGDLTGFVASCYLRGIKFVQIPTTLLAFADSSVGGKTAINLKSGKNLCGTFYQPSLVICDIAVKDTLTSNEYACGMAEIIKYGMVFDKDLLTLLEKGMTDNAVEIVARSIDWKRTVVERDEFDNSERQLLNFGHTLGHAIEIESGFEIPHGKAVAIGMHLITELAVKNGLCSKNLLRRLDNLLEKYGLPTTCEIPLERLVNRTLIDKKRKSDFITVVLPTKDGNCVLNKMTIENWKGFLISEY